MRSTQTRFPLAVLAAFGFVVGGLTTISVGLLSATRHTAILYHSPLLMWLVRTGVPLVVGAAVIAALLSRERRLMILAGLIATLWALTEMLPRLGLASWPHSDLALKALFTLVAFSGVALWLRGRAAEIGERGV